MLQVAGLTAWRGLVVEVGLLGAEMHLFWCVGRGRRRGAGRIPRGGPALPARLPAVRTAPPPAPLGSSSRASLVFACVVCCVRAVLCCYCFDSGASCIRSGRSCWRPERSAELFPHRPGRTPAAAPLRWDTLGGTCECGDLARVARDCLSINRAPRARRVARLFVNNANFAPPQ